MGLSVTILGSGTAVPVPDRFPAGALVEAGPARVLVDLGPGTLRRLAQTGADLRDIDAVLLTHYHTDHCADLGPLLFALRNPRYAGRKPLRVLGAPGLRELYGHLLAAWPWIEPRGYALELSEIEPSSFDLGPFRVQATAIEHTAQSLGYRLTAGGVAVAFSGDADLCDGLGTIAAAADLFVCDCAFPDALRQPGHLTPSLAGRVARRAGVRTLCLTHFYPECDGHDLLAQARQEFPGEIVLATDLWQNQPRSDG
jgi:ribonuclease BN (tRNA processing enzyme)